MNKFIYISLFLIGSLSAGVTEKLVWPYPPDEARIEYVNSARSSKDLGIEKGFFSKAFDFLFGEEEPTLSAPFGIHADKNRIYVTDIASKILYIFDKKEEKLITVRGSDGETFLYPIDVIADSKGNIFVTDSVRAKVYVFEKNGNYNYEIKSTLFQRPVGIAISPDEKKLYIVDTVASKIHVTTLKGKYLNSIGSRGSRNGEFNRPTFIDVSNDGRIYISDSMNHRVQVLDGDGKFISTFGHLGQEIGSFGSPRGIALDSDGNIYVSDTMFNNIQIFNQDGELLMVLGKYGSNKGELSMVEDISITTDNIIYVSDTNNKRFQIFKRLESTGKRSSK